LSAFSGFTGGVVGPRSQHPKLRHLTPAYTPMDENKQFFASTPSGKIELGLMKKEIADQFELQKEYYVDFAAAN